MALRSLSLCAGIGGIDLGLAEWCRTVCYVEREAFSASVLVARMEEAALDRATVWDDLATFDGRPWRGRVDLVTGGYPCQPFSLAGARRGAEDPRHLWPHVRRIVDEVAPSLCFFENVPGHVSLGLEDVVLDLEGMGYRVAAVLLSAADVGATHKRERLWIMGYADRTRWSKAGGGPYLDAGQEPEPRSGAVADPVRDPLRHEPGRSVGGRPGAPRHGHAGEDVADADLGRRQGLGSGRLPDDGPALRHDADGRGGRRAGNMEHAAGGGADAAQHQGQEYQSLETSFVFPPGPSDSSGWREYVRAGGPQPAVRRGAPGLPDPLDPALAFRQDRLRALGNAVVPVCAAAAFRILLTQLLQ